MGLHHREAHGRVLHGAAAAQHLKEFKAAHGSNIKMNVPAHMRAAARPADAGQVQVQNKAATDVVDTVSQVVYVTMSATFSGPIAGYTTLASSPEAAAETTSAASSARTTPHHLPNFYTAPTSSKTAQHVVASPVPSSMTSAAASASTTAHHNNKSQFLNAPASATSGSSSNKSPSSDSSAGLTTGAQAGMAIGIIGAFALAAGLLFFCWRRKKNSKNGQQEITDEKRRSSFISGGRDMQPAAARMSTHSEKDARSIRSSNSTSTAPRLSLRPVTQFLPNLAAAAQNPFSDASEKARPVSPPTNPFDEPEGALAHKKSGSFESNGSTKSGQSGGVPAGGVSVPPMGRGPNNVHRVQLDFKPSMEDELELSSGQLVRMLHEYDDGWALCVRMDRSQQGVAPRTCLSKLPVKPRPGPPPGAMRPNGPPPPGARGPGPQQGPMYPRPLTPNGQGRPRGNSNAEMPNRKPVPGMAL